LVGYSCHALLEAFPRKIPLGAP
jgi:REP-associated tyrosine transposase